jgi:hypothetical protein
MTQWGMLLLCGYIVLGATSRLTRRQASLAALALTIIVTGAAVVEYSRNTPTVQYVPSVDSSVYATGPAPRVGPGPSPTSLDVTGVTPATWLTTDHKPLVTGSGGGD